MDERCPHCDDEIEPDEAPECQPDETGHCIRCGMFLERIDERD